MGIDWKHLPSRVRRVKWVNVRDRLGHRISRVGDRYGIERLTYNPWVYKYFERVALTNGPLIAEAVGKVFPDVHSVVDVGCGTGGFAKALMDNGHKVMGVEYSARARKASASHGVDVHPFNIQAHLDQRLRGAPFDLATSIEVAEHIPEFLADRFVDYMIGAAPLIMLTAAHPGQDGNGHINEQPQSYWIEKFRACGYAHSEAESEQLRTIFQGQGASDWLSDNVMVFRATVSA